MKTPYLYHNNVMAVLANALYKAEDFDSESNVLTYWAYKSHKRSSKFIVLKNACRGQAPLLDFESMDPILQEKVISIYGDPYKVISRNRLAEVLINDSKAFATYNEFVKDDGATLSERQIKQYTAEASILKGIHNLLTNRVARNRALGNGKKAQVWDKLAQSVADLSKDQWPHKLPSNPRSLNRKSDKFQKEGYAALIHGQNGNTNSEKINADAKVWLIARWGDAIEMCVSIPALLHEYNEKAKNLRWKPLKHEKTLRDYLYNPEVEVIWHRNRHGDKSFNKKFGYIHTTQLPSMRDSLWYADGTKLNFYYQYVNDNGERKIGTTMVYEVMDAFSEVFLGYHISEKENYVAQFYAFKMAAQFSGCKPYEIKVDNQGGHKKLKSSSFLDKIAKLSLTTKPYNGQSKTIESAFGRFQKQYMKRKWFFTGQNITAHTLESKANLQLIEANKANLPTLEEITAEYLALRNEWNNAKHPKFNKTRLEMYNESKNPEAVELGIWDIVDLFWVEHAKPITCYSYGIRFQKDLIEYEYVVYENNGEQGYERDVNYEWIARNVGNKFHIKYDPTDMSLIYLYQQVKDGSLSFVCEAETKIVLHRNIQEQEEHEAGFFARVQKKQDELRLQKRDEMEAALSQHDRTAEHHGLNAPKIMGLETGKRFKNKVKKAKLQEKEASKVKKAAFAASQDADKLTSNTVLMNDEDEANFDPMAEFINQI